MDADPKFIHLELRNMDDAHTDSPETRCIMVTDSTRVRLLDTMVPDKTQPGKVKVSRD